MDGAGLHVRHDHLGRSGPELAIDAVTRGEHHLLAFVHREDRRDVRMEAIVACRRLILETFAPVDLHALHGCLLYTLPRSDVRTERSMPDHSYHVYIVQARGQGDYADCQAALAHGPARMTALPFIATEDEMIAKTRDADALVTSASPVTRGLMSALEGLKVVARTGVGYDVIDVPAATELGVIVVNIPDLWVREVANHALALLLAWNRKIVVLDRQVHSGVWSAGVPGERTGSIHGETVGIVGLGNIGSAFARRVAAFETKVIACDP